MALTAEEQAIYQQLLAKLNGGQGGANPDAKNMQGMMTMDEIMSDPEKNKAAADEAEGMDDATALGLMEMGQNKTVNGGGGLVGKMSPWEAAANAMKQGMGTYNMIKTQKAKSNSIKAMMKKKKAQGNGTGAISDYENFASDNSFPTDSFGEIQIDP